MLGSHDSTTVEDTQGAGFDMTERREWLSIFDFDLDTSRDRRRRNCGWNVRFSEDEQTSRVDWSS